MQVKIEYAAQVKRAAGITSETLEVDSAASVEDVLRSAAAKHDDENLQRILFDSTGAVHPSLLVFIGNAQVRPGDATQLREGDTVTVLSPISGG